MTTLSHAKHRSPCAQSSPATINTRAQRKKAPHLETPRTAGQRIVISTRIRESAGKEISMRRERRNPASFPRTRGRARARRKSAHRSRGAFSRGQPYLCLWEPRGGGPDCSLDHEVKAPWRAPAPTPVLRMMMHLTAGCVRGCDLS